ncbi:hypothetical protein [Solidesulfovibrio carbinolicus]|uniref:Uncharacterized protein n=1 Tax=Solidesulfovibrio carbinolicus TaxID=296842 RepID=A0A4P6HJI8_9BACT|nr:hypothetical protein [Solidesulfovibrio carbinolicus]QAZ67267.1 hypothetical protein C3Y92_08505 [Solidesulfovibrio carbinolicus]
MDYTELLSWLSYPLTLIMSPLLGLLRIKGVPESLSLIIVAGMCFVITRGWWTWRPLMRQVKTCNKNLAAMPDTGLAGVQYQNFLSTLTAKCPTLEETWSKFAQTLVQKDGGRLFLTISPATYFSVERFEGVVQLRRLAKWSGLFVGIGLLFTFLGLVAALSSASQAIQAATANSGQGQDAMQGALKDLLHAATFKFYTSIFGLLASLTVSYAEKWFRRELEGALRSFRKQLERLLPIQSPEQLLYEQLHEARETTTQIKKFNTDISEGLIRMSGAVATAMQEAVTPVHRELCEGFSTTSAAMSRAMIEAVDPVRQGLDQVGQNIGAMEQTIGRSIGENIKVMQEETLNVLASRLNQVVDQQAGAELTTMANTLETLTHSLAQMKDSLDSGGGAFAATLEAAARELHEGVAGLAEATRGISQHVAHDVSQTQAVLQERLRGIGDEMAQALTQMREAMDGAAGSVTGQSAQAVAVLGKAVEDMAETMRRTAAETGDQTARNAQSMSESIASVLQEMRDESARVAQTNQQSMERLLQVSTTARENMSVALAKVGEEVAAQGQAAAARLTDGTTTVLASLNDSLGNMGTHVLKLSTSLTEVDQALNLHGRNVREAASSSQVAAKALEAAAGSIGAASSPIVSTQNALAASVRGMEQSLRSLVDGATAMGRTASAAQTAIQQASHSLENSWQQHVGRFQGVDASLAIVLRDMLSAMDSNAAKLNQYVQSIDTHIGRAVERFSEAIEELNEIFENTLVAMKSR